MEKRISGKGWDISWESGILAGTMSEIKSLNYKADTKIDTLDKKFDNKLDELDKKIDIKIYSVLMQNDTHHRRIMNMLTGIYVGVITLLIGPVLIALGKDWHWF